MSTHSTLEWSRKKYLLSVNFDSSHISIEPFFIIYKAIFLKLFSKIVCHCKNKSESARSDQKIEPWRHFCEKISIQKYNSVLNSSKNRRKRWKDKDRSEKDNWQNYIEYFPHNLFVRERDRYHNGYNKKHY